MNANRTARSRVPFAFVAALALLAFADTTRAQNNPDLANLEPSAGTLTPVFASATITYTADVPNATAAMTVTPTAAEAGATITVDGNPVASGSPSAAINLNVGTNVITTVVVAQDTVSTKTYTLTVTRAANSDLSGLALSVGTLTPAFASATITYSASVPTATSSMTVTPTAADGGATITVNGNAVSSGSPSNPITLNVGANAITTVVTATDATTTTYTVTVTRAAPNVDLSSLVISTGTLVPSFVSATTSYTATVGYQTTSMTVTPTVAAAGATITVNDVAVVSGSASGSIRLNTGNNNVITIVVTGTDSVTTKTYTLTVNRTDSAIYEPFNYTAAESLNGQAVGASTGLTGTWTAANSNLSAGSLSYPGYPTAGNRPASFGITLGPATGSASVGATLSAAGLLAPGATLWYSALVVAQDNAGASLTRRTYVGIGNAAADGYDRYGAQGSGKSGIGLRVNGLTVAPQSWYSTASASGTAVAIPAGVNLIVGKITWSPTIGSGNHTNQIYLPDSGLVLPGTVASTQTIAATNYDQSTFTLISFAGMDPQAPQVDEIRFGASYAAVIGLANPVYWDLNSTSAGTGNATPSGTWDATTPNWNLASDGTGATAAWTDGQTAVFSAGADATGSYTVTVKDVQDIGGLTFNSGTVTLATGMAGNLRMTANTRVTVGAGTATLQTPLSDNGGNEVLSTGGKGTLILAGNNSAATGGMAIYGITRFEAPNAINGTARNTTVNSGGAVVFGPSFGAGNIPTALSNRIAAASSGVIAADNYTANNFDFNTPGLTAASLGAVGNVSYTGTLTPNGTTYRLGGGGGTLTMANANAITGSGNSLVVNGNLTLTGANDFTGGTTLTAGTLTLGSNSSLGTGSVALNGATLQSADSTAHTLTNVLTMSGNLTVGGTGNLTFSDTSATLLTSSPILTINNPATSFAQSFSGAFGITKSGTGKLTLSGTSSYTGVTTISGGGILSVNAVANHGVNSPLGAYATVGGAGLVIVGSTFQYTGPTATSDLGFYLSTTSPCTIDVNTPGTALNFGASVVNLNGTLNVTGGAGSSLTCGPLPANGTIIYNSSIKTTLNGFSFNSRAITLSGSATDCSVPGNITNTGTAGSANGITKTGTGTWTLSGTNSFNQTSGAGVTTVAINAGTLQFAKVVSLFNGATASWTPAKLPVAATATLALNVGGAGEFAATDLATFLGASSNMGSSTATAGFKTGSALGLDTTNAGGSFTPSGVLTMGSGTVGLTKLGSGSLILNVAETYTGPTLVNNGTLLVNSPGTLAAGSAVTVNGGTLGGTGTIGGSVTVAAGGSVAPGASAGSVGTLLISGGFTLSAMANGGTGKLNFELAAPAASDKIAVAGTLTIGTNVLGFNDFVFTNLGSLQAGTYTLITSGGITGTLDPANLSGSIGTFTGTLQLSGSNLQLVIAPAGFASWQAKNGTSQAINLDHDNDGVPNGIEYFIGGPNGSTTGFTPLPGVTNTAGVRSVTWTKAADYAGVYGTDYWVETSDTLVGTWIAAATNPTPNTPNTVTIAGNNVTYTFPAGSKNFARLKVTGP